MMRRGGQVLSKQLFKQTTIAGRRPSWSFVVNGTTNNARTIAQPFFTQQPFHTTSLQMFPRGRPRKQPETDVTSGEELDTGIVKKKRGPKPKLPASEQQTQTTTTTMGDHDDNDDIVSDDHEGTTPAKTLKKQQQPKKKRASKKSAAQTEEAAEQITEEELFLQKNQIQEEVHKLLLREKNSQAHTLLYEWYHFIHLQVKKEPEYLENLYKENIRHVLVDAVLLGYFGQCLAAYQQKEKSQEALGIFEECFTLLDRFHARKKQAETEEGDVAESIRQYMSSDQSKKELNDLEFAFCCSAGFLNIRFDNYEAGEIYLLRAIPLRNDHTFIFYRLALINRDRKDWERAEKFYELTIENLDNATLIGDFACFYMKYMQKYDRVEELFDRALKMDPKHAENLYNYAIYHHDITKDRQKAIQLLETAMHDKAIDPRPASFLGSILLSMNQPERARKSFLRAKGLGGFMTYKELSHYALSEVYCGNFDPAKEAYEQALKMHDAEKSLRQKKGEPDDTDLLGNYGELLFKVYRKYTDARNLFERALQADPNNYAALNSYAQLLAKLQEVERADRMFKDSIHISENDANSDLIRRLKINLASYAQFLLNQKANAEAAGVQYRRLKNLMDQDPENPENIELMEQFNDYIAKHPKYQ